MNAGIIPKISVLLIAILFSVLAVGCASISGKLPAPAAPTPVETFRAGSAKLDITPMPGFPMGGYANGGKISRGVWTRLYTRAVVFEDTEGNGLAMVACDLWAIPAGLADRVAELAATKYGVPELGREQIIIAATHTHNSPGNYSSSFFYNTFASPKSGFDRGLFDFLSHRIAQAIGRAWTNRRPAVLIRNEMALGGIGRNRSLPAFLKNSGSAELLQENSQLDIIPTAFPVGGEQAYRAIDPTLTVIRALPLHGDENPLAALAFHAVHPTAMGPATQVYTSDLIGAAATLVDRELDGAVIAIFNGAEADISANWEKQDRPSTVKLATRLAGCIKELLKKPGQDVTGPIRCSFTRTRLADLGRPMGGASQMQGSEGDWTFFRDAGWQEGLTEEDPEHQFEGHGPKKYPFDEDLLHSRMRINLPFILDKILDAPEEVPLGVYQIGDVTLGTLPGEFTTMLGRRIAGSIAQAAGTPERILLVGLANEYLSYFSTQEEYAAQHYEGASMLYGPLAGVTVKAELAGLAETLRQGQPREKKIKYSYGAGPRKSFGVKEFDLQKHMDRFEVSYMSLRNVLMDEETGIPTAYNPYVVWIDANPRWAEDPGSEVTVTPEIRIEMLVGDGWKLLEIDSVPETDKGVNFVTTVVGSYAGESRWVSIWMTPKGVNEDAMLRFVVRTTSDRIFHSQAFTIKQAQGNWGYVGFLEWAVPEVVDEMESARR